MNGDKSQSSPPEKPKPENESSGSLTEFSRQLEKRIGNLVQGKAKQQVIGQVMALVREDYSGPIPHPRHLAQYEEACPGAAERILAMAERSLDAQITIAKTEVESEASDRRTGMILGFSALALLIGGAVVCAVAGQIAVASAFIGVGALGTVGRFIHGRNSGHSNNSKK